MSDYRKETEILLRSVLLPHKDGLPLDNVSREFKALTGKQIFFRKLGYTSLRNFLMESKVCEVYCRHNVAMVRVIADETTKHIEKMVKEQRSQTNHGGRQFPDIKNRLRDPDVEKCNVERNELTELKRPIVEKAEPVGRILPGNLSLTSEDTKKRDACLVPDSVRVRLKKLLQEQPKEISMKGLLEKFKEKYNHPILVEEYGFTSNEDFFDNGIGDFCHRVGPDSDQVIGDKKEVPKLESTICLAPAQLYRELKVLNSLLHRFPEGVHVDNLNYELNKEFGWGIDPLQYNFKNMKTLIACFSKVFTVRISDWRVFSAETTSKAEAAGWRKVTQLDEDMSIDVEVGDAEDLHSVLWASTRSPMSFKFIFSKNVDEIVEFQREITKFYAEHHRRLSVEGDEKLGKDSIMVTRTSDGYFRVIIEKIEDNKKYRAICLDTGKHFLVGNEELFYLVQKFHLLPYQAVEAHLHYTLPPNGKKWTAEDFERFKNLMSRACGHGGLHAVVKEVRGDKSVGVVLYDTVLNKNLNELMIGQKNGN